MGELPGDAARLLAVAPQDFVRERGHLARELKAAGRTAEAAAVAALRKPTAVVLAVNRAARDRPRAARDAADSALRIGRAQLSGDAEAFRKASKALERSLEVLADAAIAHLAPSGRSPSDAMRRRVHELLRSAVAGAEGRAALARGALTAETAASGFAPFAGIAPQRRRTGPRAGPDPPERERRRARERALRDALAQAERALQEAERSVRHAVRERDKAERALDAARGRFRRLGAGSGRP